MPPRLRLPSLHSSKRSLATYPLLTPRITPHQSSLHRPQALRPPHPLSLHPRQPWRHYATKSTADEKIEEITEIYATAKDEFDIATEETSKKSVYADDDRAAAREELEKLKSVYEEAIRGEGGEEVRRRVGGRVRELERGVEDLESRAVEEG